MIESLASWSISVLSRFVSKTTPIITVAGDVITAGELESAAGTLGGFLTAYQAAVKAKSYTAEFELGVDEAVTIAADVGVPYAGLAAQVLPLVFALVNAGGFQVSPNSETGDWKSNF